MVRVTETRQPFTNARSALVEQDEPSASPATTARCSAYPLVAVVELAGCQRLWRGATGIGDNGLPFLTVEIQLRLH